MTALDLTAGGRLTVSPLVTERKVLAMTEMLKGSKLGGHAGQRARVDLAETLSTSDAPFSFAHLVNLRNLPQYEEAEPDFDPIVRDEDAPDFDPVTFYSFTPNFAGLEHGKDNDGQRIAPLVAELDTYQYAFGYTQEDTSIALEKRGFKTGWSLERGVKNVFNLVNRMPGDMFQVGRKTDQYVVYRALTQGVTSASELNGGDVDYITGKTVPADSPATPQALRVAIRQIGQRTDANGVRVPVPARFRLVVGLGQAESIEWNLGLARGLYEVADGDVRYRTTQTPGDPLNRIRGIIESEFLDDTEWYLVPEDDAVERPALIRLSLLGYRIPEVYVSNFNGVPVLGGASNNPFQAYSFDNDSVDLKFRLIRNTGLFSEDAIVWSNGTYEPSE